MRKLFTFIVALFITGTLLGQAPASFKYQSVLRDSRGNFRANTNVSIGIDIIQGTVSGTTVYSENHSVTTDGFGLINLEIGKGVPSKSTLSAISWGTDTYFIRIFVDGIEMGTSQLLSVPYALHAKTAEKLVGGITETDPNFTASPANGISSASITNWNTSASWGDHAAAGYLTSYTETDPSFKAWDKSSGISITTSQISDFLASINTSGSGAFDANKTVTRTGLNGITGSNFNTTTIIDFLNRVFFPVLSPTITSFRYDGKNNAGQFSYQEENATTKVVTDHAGSVIMPYSEWNTPGSNIVFNYSITKRDPNIAITKVELFKNGVAVGTVSSGSLSGSFSLQKSSFTSSEITQNIPLTLKVTDNASNIVSLVLNVSIGQMNGVTLSDTRISASNSGNALKTPEGSGTWGDPYLIERTGSDMSYFFVWTINGNDDAGKVTNISFSGTPALTSLTNADNITQTYVSPVIFPHADATTKYQVGASAKGSVANNFSSTSYSDCYQLQDRTFCGFLPTNAPPSISDIVSLQSSSLKTDDYTAMNGVILANGTGSSGFFTWAIPTYVDGNSSAPAFSKTVYYYAIGNWFTNSNTTVHSVKVPNGSTSSWYWVCIYNASTANGVTVQAKIN